LKEHPRGIAVLAERLFGKTVDVSEPAAIAVEHLALVSLTLVSRWFRWRPVRVQHSQQSVDRTGIPGSPLARVLGKGPISLFEAIQLRFQKAFDVNGASRFYRNALLLQITKELASC
jgi:hypothetical protein